MPTTLIDNFSTFTEHGRPRVSYPFANYPTPDIYARTIRRTYDGPAADHTPATATRTSYTNYITHSEDLTNAAWMKTTSGSGSLPIVGAGYTGPDGRASAFAVYLNSGLGGTLSDYSFFGQAITGLANPHARTISVWLRALSGGPVIVGLYTGDAMSTLVTVTSDWQRFSFTPAAAAATTDEFHVFVRGGTGTGHAADLVVAYPQFELASTPGPYIPTTSAARTISAPDLDTSTDTVVPADPFAYLVEETDPQPNENLTLCRYEKTFARIPADQVRYASRVFTKPVVGNEISTTYSAENVFAPDTEIATVAVNNTGIWLSDGRVFAPFASNAAAATGAYATAGTFTVTYKTSTTAALAYNASAATINAAINALGDVVTDGLTVSVSNSLTTNPNGTLSLALTAGSTVSEFSLDASGLTTNVTGGNKAFCHLVSSTVQKLSLCADLSVSAGHGCATSTVPLIALVNETGTPAYVIPANKWGIYNSVTLQLPKYNEGNRFVNIVTYVAPYLRDYTSGSVTVSSRITERYYLPGVSSGVTSIADIPITSPNISDEDVIAAILNTTGYQPVDFEGPAQWMGAIHRTITTEIDLDDI